MRESYLQTQKEAKEIRERAGINANPILQNSEQYVTKKIIFQQPKNQNRPRIETKNYNVRNLGYKEPERPKKKVIEVKDCLNSNFKDQSEQIDNKPKKKVLAEEYEKKIHKPQPKSIKMIEEARGKKDTMNDIFLGKAEEKEYRFSKRQIKNGGIPSYETLRINQQFNNNNLNNNKINEYRNDILKKYNTDHLFNQGSDSDYNNERSHKKIFPLNSNMGDILAHDNVPKGYDVYSSKPNEVNYKTLVNSLPDNFDNIKKYGKKVY